MAIAKDIRVSGESQIKAHQSARSMNKKPIYAISESESQINQILNNLFRAGSSNYDISVLPPGRSSASQSDYRRETKVCRSAISGAGVGGLVFASVGLLANFGEFTILGIVRLLVAGAIIGAVAALLAGAYAGKISTWRIRWGLSGIEARRQQYSIPEGNFLISIRALNRNDDSRVKKIGSSGILMR